MSSSSGSVGNKRSTSASGSSATGSGSDSGRILRSNLDKDRKGSISIEQEGEEKGKGKGKGRETDGEGEVEKIPLHHSLPPKPVWASVLPPSTNGTISSNGGRSNLPAQSPGLPIVVAGGGGPIVGGAVGGGQGGGGGRGGGQGVGGTTFYTQSNPPTNQQTSYIPYPQQSFTYDRSTVPLSGYPGVGGVGGVGGGGGEEIRRPTPRSTALFDPNGSSTVVGKDNGSRGGKEVGGLVDSVVELHLQ